jgi:hypothetical protein
VAKRTLISELTSLTGVEKPARGTGLGGIESFLAALWAGSTRAAGTASVAETGSTRRHVHQSAAIAVVHGIVLLAVEIMVEFAIKSHKRRPALSSWST